MYFNNLILDLCNIPKEYDDDSFIEHKRHITKLNDKLLEKRITQMLKRLYEGYSVHNKMMCIYLLGINDDGSIYGMDKRTRNITIKNLKKMMKGCNASVYSYHIRKINSKYVVQLNIISDITPEHMIL